MVEHEHGTKHDANAVVVKKYSVIVDHLPRAISRVSWFFCRVTVTVYAFLFVAIPGHTICYMDMVPRPWHLMETLHLMHTLPASIRNQRLLEPGF